MVTGAAPSRPRKRGSEEQREQEAPLPTSQVEFRLAATPRGSSDRSLLDAVPEILEFVIPDDE